MIPVQGWIPIAEVEMMCSQFHKNISFLRFAPLEFDIEKCITEIRCAFCIHGIVKCMVFMKMQSFSTIFEAEEVSKEARNKSSSGH